MNTLTNIQKVKFLAVVVLISWALQGCEKEEYVPDYVGTWVSEQDLTKQGGSPAVRDMLDFSEGSFTNLGQVKDIKNDKWLDFIGVKGRIIIKNDVMQVEVLEMGISKIDVFSGLPTGLIHYYRPDQAEFTTIINKSHLSTSYQSNFLVTGNKLTLQTDKNNDGDFADQGEITTFVKQ